MSLEDDDMERATEYKTEGGAAWAKGDFSEALECFSKAIEATPDDGSQKDFLKILFSNRSAAYLKVNLPETALKDANKCIQLDANWTKGHARKGDALLSSKQYTDAYNAYNTGLRTSPGDKNLTDKAEQAMRSMRNASNPPPSNSRFFPNQANSASYTSPTISTPQKYLKLGSFLMAFLYLIPLSLAGLGTLSLMFYKASAVASGLSTLVGLYTTHGMPKFTADYGMKVISDTSTLRLFLSVYLLTTRPYILALLCQVLPDLTYFTSILCEYALKNLSAVEGHLKGLITRFTPQLADIQLERLFEPAQVAVINQQMHFMSCTLEVYQGIFLVIELMLPTRNPVMLYMWWQYLQIRYMLDKTGQTKQAFNEIDGKIEGLLQHQMCPSLLRKGYGLIKDFMAKQVRLPTAGGVPEPAAGGGMMGGMGATISRGVASAMSKCTIM